MAGRARLALTMGMKMRGEGKRETAAGARREPSEGVARRESGGAAVGRVRRRHRGSVRSGTAGEQSEVATVDGSRP